MADIVGDDEGWEEVPRILDGMPTTLVRATTFANHMRPDIDWLPDPEFDAAFDELMGAGEPAQAPCAPYGVQTMAAFTKPITPYPGYLSMRFEGGNAILTVRGDHIFLENGDENVATEAPTAQISIPQGDWDQFVAEATRERGLVPGG